MTYHRFESQHIVGKEYPWYPIEQVVENIQTLKRSTSRPETLNNARTPTWTPSITINNVFEDSTQVDNKHEEENLLSNVNTTDDDKIENSKQKIQTIIKADVNIPCTSQLPEESNVELRSYKRLKSTSDRNIPDDDMLDHIEDMKSYLRKHGDDVPPSTPSEHSNDELNTVFDRTPSFPPPPRPTSLYLPPFMNVFKIKDMLVFNAQNMIKTHVPHLPAGFFKDDPKPNSNDDTVFIMPTRKRTINGLEQDDILGKYVVFTGWFLFLIMRMLALATFSVFYLNVTIYLCLAHYFIMLFSLYFETRFHTKLHRTIFYLFLAYIYIFCLIEFKIKFVHIKTWYIGYFFLVFIENLIITMIWYFNEIFFSWWFHMMWYMIITSAILSLLCHIFYYFVLRPKDKILFVNDDEQE